ncbi:MAG: C45 family peptidase [Bdellovibrionota bacterium]
MLKLILLPLLLLYALAGVSHAQERRPSTPAQASWYNTRFPVPVMHLEGSIEEIARSHGQIAARQPDVKTTLEFMGKRIEHQLEQSPLLSKSSVLRKLVASANWAFIGRPMIEHLPEKYEDAYREFAKALRVSEELVFNALVLPDTALRAVSLFYESEQSPVLPQSLGCTSIIWNSGSVSAFHGRNLDYEGVGYWDRKPVIVHSIPKEGLAHVSVTALGVHALGITAFNEAGLTLAVHQLTLSDTQASGTPVPVISAEVIRSARTIDDAIAIIRSFPRAGGWAYVLSQGLDRAVVETSAHEIAIRRSSEPFFYQTNHVSSPALSKDQVFYTPGSWLDSFERAETLSQYAKKGHASGWATAERMTALLGQHHRVAGGTIAKLDNIQSVIFDANHRRLWVAAGTDERAPNENRYYEYRWSDLRSSAPPKVMPTVINVGFENELGKTGWALRSLLRQASSPALTGNPQKRTAFLEEYAKLVGEKAQSTESSLRGYWAGLYYGVWHHLRHKSLEPTTVEALLKTLDLALKDPDLNEKPSEETSPIRMQAQAHRLSLGRLYRARLFDLLGKRSAALLEYAVVKESAPFERVRLAAARGLRNRFDEKRARATAIDWVGVDLFNY